VGDQSVDARIILKSIFKQKNVKMYTVVSGTELCNTGQLVETCKYNF